MSNHVFFGRRTNAFNVVADPLVVVEFHKAAETGIVRQLRELSDLDEHNGPIVGSDVVETKSDASAGHRAYRLQDGVYEVASVDWVPVTKRSLIKISAGKCVPITEAELRQALPVGPPPSVKSDSPKAEFPALTGADAQVAWATKIRDELMQKMLVEGFKDAGDLLAKPFAAAWFIARREHSLSELHAQLLSLSPYRQIKSS